jgi:hypothetical protein
MNRYFLYVAVPLALFALAIALALPSGLRSLLTTNLEFQDEAQLAAPLASIPANIANEIKHLTNAPSGYTSFKPSTDTKFIFVSNSQGVDSNDGRTPDRPVQTLTKALELVQEGRTDQNPSRPDWVLLKRGDTWTITESMRIVYNGRSESEPLLIGSYGSSGARPIIQTRGDMDGISMLGKLSSGSALRPKNVAIVGLHIRSLYHNGRNGKSGIHFYGPFENILIEDDYVQGFVQNISTETCQNDIGGSPCHPNSWSYDRTKLTRKNLKIRKSIIVGAWRATSGGVHPQNIYIAETNGITLEFNVIMGGGRNDLGLNNYDTGAPKNGPPTDYNKDKGHNVYLQYDNSDKTNVAANFFLDGASHGIQVRNGGRVVNNVFARNHTHLLIGLGSNNSVLGNRFFETSMHMKDGGNNMALVPGTAVEIKPSNYTEFRGNIIANSRNPAKSYGLVVSNRVTYLGSGQGDADLNAMVVDKYAKTFKVNVTDNIIYNAGGSLYLEGGNRSGKSITYTNNDFQSNNGNYCFAQRASDWPATGQNTFVNNDFYCNFPEKFVYVDADNGQRFNKTFQEWQQSFDPNRLNREQKITYKSPDNVIENEMRSMGKPATYEAFVATLLTLSKDQKFSDMISPAFFVGDFGVATNPTNQQSTFKFTFPTNNAVLKRGQTYDITWTGIIPGHTKVDLSLPDKGLVEATIANGKYAWTLANDLELGSHFIVATKQNERFTAGPFTVVAANSTATTTVPATTTPTSTWNSYIGRISIVNADTDLDLPEFTNIPAGGATIDLNTSAAQRFNVVAHPNGPVGSIVFKVTGATTHNETQNTAPYPVFGDNGGNFNAHTPVVGTYTITATPYEFANGGGKKGPEVKRTITFTRPSQATPKMTVEEPNPTTYTAGNFIPVKVVYEQVPSKNLTLAVRKVGTTQNIQIQDHNLPTVTGTFVGQVKLNANLAAGFYYINACTGSGALCDMSETFMVQVPQTSTWSGSITALNVFNATNDQQLSGFAPLTNNASINLSTVGTEKLNITPSTSGSVGSVKFTITGPITVNRTENTEPFAAFGDTGGNLDEWSPGNGTYTITATPYELDNGGGAKGADFVRTFTITRPAQQQAAQSVTNFTLINANTNQPIAGYETISDDMTINLHQLPTRSLSLRANTNPSTVGSVKFTVSPTDSGNASNNGRVENTKPYSFSGDDNGDYYDWVPQLKTYAITAAPYTGQDAGGTKGTEKTINLTFTNVYTRGNSSVLDGVAAAFWSVYNFFFPL